MLLKILHPHALSHASGATLSSLRRNRQLLMEQIKRELFDQHAGQMLGTAWTFLHPLFIMMVYVFVFGVVFKQRIGGTYELPLDFTSYIISGLAPWLAIVQSLTKTSGALTTNSALIKQVVFPIEILPVKAALSTLLPLLVMLGVYFIYTVGYKQELLWTQLLIPVLVFIYVVWTTGIGMILASLSVFVRDVRELVQLFAVAGVFLLPIIYLPQWVPSVFKPLLYLNPFSYLIWCFQDALYFGRFEHPFAWVVAIFGGVLLFAIGARMFRGLKPYFGDAL